MDYVKLTRAINNKMYALYNGGAYMLYLLRFFKLKPIRSNIEFKNKHKGERCFILGLGPSLKEVNLEILKNETIFTVNSYYLFDTKRVLQPNYYFMMDHGFRGHLFHEVEKANQIYPKAKFFYNIRSKKINDEKLADNSNSHYLYSRYIPHDDAIKFDLTKNITAGVNVIHYAIQAALYMGFSEIYLLGCDFNYVATRFKQTHCYDEQEVDDLSQHQDGLACNLERLTNLLYHHDGLARIAKKNNIKIFNATKGSYITSYPFKEEILDELEKENK